MISFEKSSSQEPEIDDIDDFTQLLFESGIKSLFLSDLDNSDDFSKFETYSFSEHADVKVVNSKTLNESEPDKRFSYFATLNDNSNLDEIVNAAKNNAESIIIEFEENTEWKIIPLENLIAELHGLKTKIFTVINDPSEIKTN